MEALGAALHTLAVFVPGDFVAAVWAGEFPARVNGGKVAAGAGDFFRLLGRWLLALSGLWALEDMAAVGTWEAGTPAYGSSVLFPRPALAAVGAGKRVIRVAPFERVEAVEAFGGAAQRIAAVPPGERAGAIGA